MTYESNSTDQPEALLAAARETAVLAGEKLRHLWQRPREISHKGFRDLVTDADVAAQQLIVDNLRRRFPTHAFLTEEEADLPENGPFLWVIDPVDGTTNYSRQIPIYCISIAAVDTAAAQVAAGAIYDPMRDELFSAVRGGGATLNGEPLCVSSVSHADESVISLDWSHSTFERGSTLATLGELGHAVHTLRAFGSAALALAWVAAGRLDAYLNFNLKPWDIAAGSLLIEEAGGTLTDWHGRPWRWRHEDSACLGSNGRIQPALAPFLRRLEVE